MKLSARIVYRIQYHIISYHILYNDILKYFDALYHSSCVMLSSVEYHDMIWYGMTWRDTCSYFFACDDRRRWRSCLYLDIHGRWTDPDGLFSEGSYRHSDFSGLQLRWVIGTNRQLWRHSENMGGELDGKEILKSPVDERQEEERRAEATCTNFIAHQYYSFFTLTSPAIFPWFYYAYVFLLS